eukprot:CAMPEP_0114497860 /NCGR_PEP_ID=MMETSP0109-20121206/6561_1 /TAXON_ID=29199 /ORGANISM="Chlorarachnion reptans, Strain CCCM449" /LENGTH=346 /DNA_ID=CAMNT_0001675293 /DNA_START=25 /DNA_END=1066 /DNA_ORIENTATION=-
MAAALALAAASRSQQLLCSALGLSWPQKADMVATAVALYESRRGRRWAWAWEGARGSLRRQARHLLAHGRHEGSTAASFAVRTRHSTVCGGGTGAFVERGRVASAGTLLGFYPGIVYRVSPGDLDDPLRFEGAEEGDGYGKAPEAASGVRRPATDEYLITRSSGDVLDGDPQSEFVASAVKGSPHNWGHLVNHPPSGTAPNASFWPLEFDRAGFEDLLLQERLPWCLCKYPFEGPLGVEYPLPGMALVSLRTIEEGEELFVDYDYTYDESAASWILSPTSRWYSPVSRGQKRETVESLLKSSSVPWQLDYGLLVQSFSTPAWKIRRIAIVSRQTTFVLVNPADYNE